MQQPTGTSDQKTEDNEDTTHTDYKVLHSQAQGWKRPAGATFSIPLLSSCSSECRTCLTATALNCHSGRFLTRTDPAPLAIGTTSQTILSQPGITVGHWRSTRQHQRQRTLLRGEITLRGENLAHSIRALLSLCSYCSPHLLIAPAAPTLLSLTKHWMV